MFEIFKWKNERQQYQNQLEELKESIAENNKRFEEQGKELTYYKEELSKSQVALGDKKLIISRLEQEVIDIETKDSKIKKLQIEYDNLSGVKDKRAGEINKLENEVQEKYQKSSELNESLEKLDKEINNKAIQIEEYVAIEQASEIRMQQLSGQCENISEQLDTCRVQKEKLESSIADLITRNEVLEKTALQLRDAVNRDEKTLEIHVLELENLEQKKQLQRETIEQLQLSIDQLKLSKEQLVTANQEIFSKKQTLEDQLVQLKVQVEETQHYITQKDQLLIEIDELENQKTLVEAISGQRKVIEEQIMQLEENLVNKQVVLQRCESKSIQIHQEIDNEEKVHRQLKAKNDELEVYYNKILNELEKIESKCDTTKIEHGKYQKQLESCKQELIEQEQQKKKVENYVTGQNSIIEKYEKEIKTLKQDRVSLIQEISNLENRQKELENEVNTKDKKEAEEAAQKIDKNKESLKETTNKVDSLEPQVKEGEQIESAIQLDKDWEVDAAFEELFNNIFEEDKTEEEVEKTEIDNIPEETMEQEVPSPTENVLNVDKQGEPFILYCKEQSLKQIESKLEEPLRNVQLVGQISLDEENYEHLASLLKEAVESSGFNSTKIRYPDSLTVFMVFTGTYRYDSQYWEYIESYFPGFEGHNLRNGLMEVFHQVLKKYNLSAFESDEKTFKNVTAILFQAMIPNFSMTSIIQLIEEEMNYQNNILDVLYEIRDTFSYRLDKPVQRYIDYLKDEWETLFVEIQEVLEGSQANRYLTLSQQMIETIQNYTAKEYSQSTTSKERIGAPKLGVDADGIGIYLDLPEQRLYRMDIHDVNWCIMYKESNDRRIEAEVHYSKDYYFTKSIKLPIQLEDEVKVQLEVDGKVAKVWEFKDLAQDYLAFNQAGRWEGSKVVTSKSQIVLLSKAYSIQETDVILEELESLPKLDQYKVYAVALEGKTHMTYKDRYGKEERIFIQKINRPELKGGKLLFGEVGAKEEKVRSYVQIPDIYMYELLPKEHLHIVKLSIKRTLTNEQVDYTLDQLSGMLVMGASHTRIMLHNSAVIPIGAYGHYEITVYKGRRVLGKVGFSYTPSIEVAEHPNKTSKIYDFIAGGQEQLKFEEGKLLDQSYTKDKRYKQTWEFSTKRQFVQGTIWCKDIKSRKIVLPIRKQIRNLSWGIMDGEKLGQPKWSIKPFNMSLEELNHTPQMYLLIEGESIFRSQYMNLRLVNHQGKTLKSIDGHKRQESSNKLRINLVEFIELLKTINNDTYELQLYLRQGEKVSQYSLVHFKQKMLVTELVQVDDGSTLTLKWKEDSSFVGREMLLYPLEYTWEEPIIYSIEDNKCKLEINKKQLYNGRYAVELRYQKDEWDFEDGDELWQVDSLMVLEVVDGGTYTLEAGIESELHQLLRGQRLSGAYQIDKYELTQIYPIILRTLMIIGNNPRAYDSESLITSILNRYGKIIKQYPEKYMQYLLENDLDHKMIKEYCDRTHMLSLVFEQGLELSQSNLRKLWQAYPMLACLITLQSQSVDRRESMEQITQYVGQEGLSALIQKQVDNSDCDPMESIDEMSHDFTGCMQHLLWGDCYCSQVKTSLKGRLLGDYDDIVEHFNEIVKEMNITSRYKAKKNFAKVAPKPIERDDVFLKKTYVDIMLPLRKRISVLEHVHKEIQELLTFKIAQIKELMSEKSHQKINRLLEKRRGEAFYPEYWCGVIAYIQICQKRKLMPTVLTPELSDRLSQLLLTHMGELYERDLIIFELYHIVEG